MRGEAVGTIRMCSKGEEKEKRPPQEKNEIYYGIPRQASKVASKGGKRYQRQGVEDYQWEGVM